MKKILKSRKVIYGLVGILLCGCLYYNSRRNDVQKDEAKIVLQEYIQERVGDTEFLTITELPKGSLADADTYDIQYEDWQYYKVKFSIGKGDFAGAYDWKAVVTKDAPDMPWEVSGLGAP